MIKDRVLSLEMYSPEHDGIYEIGVTEFKKYCKAMMMTDEEIEAKVIEGLAPFKSKLMSFGLSEEEADAKIDQLLEEEASELQAPTEGED